MRYGLAQMITSPDRHPIDWRAPLGKINSGIKKHESILLPMCLAPEYIARGELLLDKPLEIPTLRRVRHPTRHSPVLITPKSPLQHPRKAARCRSKSETLPYRFRQGGQVEMFAEIAELAGCRNRSTEQRTARTWD